MWLGMVQVDGENALVNRTDSSANRSMFGDRGRGFP